VSDDADRRRAAEALCVRCGLCCDGTFFGSVVVAGGERERLGRVGLRVVDEDGKLSMPQPCSALRGCLCAVYADRPGACRQYECRMRERLLDGSVSEEDARASLARIRVLLASVRDAFDLQGSSIWEAILAIDALAATDEMSAADGRRLDGGVAALSELLELARDTFEPAAGGGGR
jgi:Fe-S-cluster containining protein